jgi:hypothetical protein
MAGKRKRSLLVVSGSMGEWGFLTLKEFSLQHSIELEAVERWIASGRLSERNGLSEDGTLIDPFKFARCYPMRRASNGN